MAKAKKIDVVGWNNLYCSAGKAVNEWANARASYSTSAQVVAHITKDSRWKLLSYGYAYGDKDNQKWYALMDPKGQVVYVRKDLLAFYSIINTAKYSAKDLDTFLTSLRQVNQSVYLRVLQCANLLAQAKKKGINTTKYDAQFLALNQRLAVRQAEMSESKLFKSKTGFNTSWTDAFKVYKAFLSGLHGTDGTESPSQVGLAPVIIAAVCIAILAGTALTGYAIYQIWKPKYQQSTTDLKISDTLKKALEKLTPGEKHDVVKDLENQIDDAYSQGQSDSKWNGILGMAKPMIIGVVGLFIVSKFIDYQTAKHARK